jgi:hypothetical protein
MKRNACNVFLLLLITMAYASAVYADDCVSCHKEVTPNIVSDWELSTHSENEVECMSCHGDGHTTAEDIADVEVMKIRLTNSRKGNTPLPGLQ